MALFRTTKTIAKRVDPSDLRSPGWIIRCKRWGLALCGVLGLGWFATMALTREGGKLRIADGFANPGPVSSAHSMFQNDCTQCHTGEKPGQFFRSVTDAACLNCHDGAIHHSNQRIAKTAAEVDRARFTLAIADDKHPGGALTAACTSCHVEHRGHVALAGISDMHCLVCHVDLNSAAQAPPKAQAQVGAFTTATHPTFGRKLKREGKWFDPTVLKFNHQYHLEKVPELKNAADQCGVCHSSTNPTAGAANSSDRRYMQPVTYTQHCARCHMLDLPGSGPTIAHEDMSLVRAQIGTLSSLFASRLATISADDRAKALVEEVPGSGRRSKPTTKPISPDEWVQKQIAKTGKEVTDWFDTEDAARHPGHAQVKAAIKEGATLDEGVLEHFVAYGSSNSCLKCHGLNSGVVETVAANAPGQPLLATIPTGYPKAPRRWFAAGQFNHDAHRFVGCIDCHTGAPQSTLTSDVLLPDLDTKTRAGQSCVACHQPKQTMHQRFAPADCVTCHQFHDRSKDRPPATGPS